MNWSPTHPTEPGWYWFRHRNGAHSVEEARGTRPWKEMIVRVSAAMADNAVAFTPFLRIDSLYGGPYGSDREWAGPIPTPDKMWGECSNCGHPTPVGNVQLPPTPTGGAS